MFILNKEKVLTTNKIMEEKNPLVKANIYER